MIHPERIWLPPLCCEGYEDQQWGDDPEFMKMCCPHREPPVEYIRADLVPQWQPIETAPADVDVLLYCPELGVANRERIELGFARSSSGKWRHSWATHWILPPKPLEV